MLYLGMEPPKPYPRAEAATPITNAEFTNNEKQITITYLMDADYQEVTEFF